MARTNLPLTATTPNSSIAYPAGTNVDVSNGMNIAFSYTGVPKAAGPDSTILIVANTAASAKNVTVRAGVGGGATAGPAFRSGLGDLVVSVTNGTTAIIGPLDPSRFCQLDGSVNVDFGSGMTGTIIALTEAPRF